MAFWYTDTTAGGLNDGTSKANAWTAIRSAFEWAGYAPGDASYVRRGQTHTMTDSDCTIVDSGNFDEPIRIIGDNDSLDIWADAGDVRPIIDWGALSRDLTCAADYWEFHNLEFVDGEEHTVELSDGAYDVKFYNCKWSDTGQTPKSSLKVSQFTCTHAHDCTFEANVSGAAIDVAEGGTVHFVDTTVDNAAVGLRLKGGCGQLENIVFGGTTPNNIDIEAGPGEVEGRNVTFNAAVNDIVMNPDEQSFVVIEDYNGVKNVWHKQHYHGILNSFAAAATVAGQRVGGAVIVIRAIAAVNVSEFAPLMTHEQSINVPAGTYTVDIYIQPTGWGVVPDTQGADADIWVEVLGWDDATWKYLYFDSRDEGAQDAQVNDEWNKIRVTNVDADVTGPIIVRLWQIRGDGADMVYIDRIIEVA